MSEEEGVFGVGSTTLHVCSICRQPYQGYGHNAQPVNDGRCCDRCNREVVVPTRMGRLENVVIPKIKQ